MTGAGFGATPSVIPAKAGIHRVPHENWIPVFAGMTGEYGGMTGLICMAGSGKKASPSNFENRGFPETAVQGYMAQEG